MVTTPHEVVKTHIVNDNGMSKAAVFMELVSFLWLAVWMVFATADLFGV